MLGIVVFVLFEGSQSWEAHFSGLWSFPKVGKPDGCLFEWSAVAEISFPFIFESSEGSEALFFSFLSHPRAQKRSLAHF